MLRMREKGGIMDKKSIGNLISYERNLKKISLQQLASGICSVSALQRIECGERLPDFFVLERIIERLGKSVNKIEFLYNEAAYEIYYLRELIDRFTEKKEYEEAIQALAYYERQHVAKEPIHRQYIYKMQAIIAAEKEQNHQKAKELLELAFAQTVKDFSLQCLEKYVLGEGELLLLLMRMQEEIEIDDVHTQIEEKRMLQYIEQLCQDEEVAANVYSKAAWVFGTAAMKQKNWREALWYTLQGEKLLADNGLLVHLPQFLERILFLTGKQDLSLHTEWKKQRDALKKLYEEYEEEWEANGIELWKNYRQQEVYLVSELFGQERKLVNESQERLADMLEIDQKTISRIESGKYKPKAGTFQKMKEYLQIDRDICTTRIVADDFRLLELERKIAKLNHYQQEEKAEVLYKQLKAELSMEWKENVQYVKYMDTLFETELRGMKREDTVSGCMEAFHVTRANTELEQIDAVVLSRTEAFILNDIARCYDRMGRKAEAIELLEKIVHGYENSKVDLKYHYAALALVYQHLAVDCEECDRLEEAVEWCDRSIRFELRCKRGLAVGFVLSQKVYTLDRMRGDRTLSRESYQQAYQIMKVMKKERRMKSLRKAYMEWYGEEIDEQREC